MTNSILDTIKKMLGIDVAYNAFDTDIIILINSAMMTLSQIGLGSVEGFKITDSSTTWEEYLTEDNLEGAKNYIYLRVKTIFDPPSSSFVLDAYKKEISEYEWRIKTQLEIINKGGRSNE